MSVVVVAVGDRRVAIDAERALAVTPLEGLTRLRSASAPALVGLVAVRGAVAPVVDPRAALALPPLDADGPLDGCSLVVVSAPAGRFALVVDDVDAVVPSPPDDVTTVEVDDLLAGCVGAG